MPHNPKPPTSPERVASLVSCDEVLQWVAEQVRAGRKPRYREIADHFQIAVSTAHGYVKRGVDAANERLADNAEVLRDVELEYIDQVTHRLWSKLDVKDTEVLVKVAAELRKHGESRRKLLGLDGPIKVKHDVEVTWADIAKEAEDGQADE